METINIEIGKLIPNPANPRKDVGDINELSESIKQNGLYQPLTVVPVEDNYMVLIGHRRLEAAKTAGLTEIPCIIQTGDIDEVAAMGIMLQENMHRADLNLKEQANGFQMMLDMGAKVDDISKITGFSKSTIRHRAKMKDLDDEKFQKSIERGATLAELVELEQIKDVKERNKVLEAVGTKNFNNELESAKRRQNNKEIYKQWKKELAEHNAVKIDTRPEDVEYIRSFSSYSAAPLNLTDDCDGATEIYYVENETETYISVYAKMEKKQPELTPEDAARKEFAEAESERENQIKEMASRFNALREKFIKDFSADKKYANVIFGYLTELCATSASGYGCSLFNCEVINKYLNWFMFNAEKDSESWKELEPEDRRSIAKTSPVYSALATIMSYYTGRNSVCYSGVWDSNLRAYSAEYHKSELTDLYAFLEKIGYQISDEEAGYINGTHPLFVQTEIPEILQKKEEEVAA